MELTVMTRRRVIAFYERLWAGKAVFDAQQIISRLPDCLRVTIAKELYREMGTSLGC